MSGFSGDGLMSALMNPGVNALAGFAGGMAQAAMPSRLPVPFGAALGFGAQGALQGAGNSLSMQQQAQQLQAQKLQNVVGQSAVPLEVAKNKALLNFWQGGVPSMSGGGTPFGVPQTGSGSPGSVAPELTGGDGNATPGGSTAPPTTQASAGPDYTKATSAALSSLPDDNTRNLALNAVLKAGLSPAQIAPWLSTIQNESGGNLNEPDSKTGAIGPGQVEPATGQGLGYTPQQLRDPLTNLTASARYFRQQWGQAGGDPLKTMAGYNTGSTSANDPDYVSRGQQRLAQWGYPGMTGGGAGGTSSDASPSDGSVNVTPAQALQLSQQYMAQADQLQQQQSYAKFMQSQGFPVTMPPGDPDALRTAAQQYRALALAGPTAKVQADADIYKNRHELITTRAGIYDPTTNSEVYRQPELVTLEDQNGTQYRAFATPGPNGTIAYSGLPAGVDPSKMSEIGPGQEELIKSLADDYGTEDRQKYEGAQNSLFQLDQQDQNLATMNLNGGWTSSGYGNNARMEWAKGINSAFGVLGITPVVDPAKVASWEDATKVQTQLAFAQAKQLGSREAQMIIQMSRAATPGSENTPQGYQAISSAYREMNNREVDLYNFKTDWLQNHGGNLTGAETTFNNQFTPKMYSDRAISTLHPFKITATDQAGAMKQMQQYLPGTVVELPNGKTSMVPQWPGAPQIPDNLMGYVQGGGNGG